MIPFFNAVWLRRSCLQHAQYMLLAETSKSKSQRLEWLCTSVIVVFFFFLMNVSWLFETQQKRFLNRKKVKGHWTNLPCILDGAVSGTHPKLYCTISWFRAAFAYVIRHCAFVYTHTLPAHLQIFTLLFYCECLLRDLCVCIAILRVNKVYMQRWMATYALLFLTGLGAFDIFFF